MKPFLKKYIYSVFNLFFNIGVVALDGLLYVIGGSYNCYIVDSTEYYNPETNTWTIVTASTNYPHTSGGIVAINMPRHFKTC